VPGAYGYRSPVMLKVVNNLVIFEEFFVLNTQQKELFIKNANDSWATRKLNKGLNTQFVGCELLCKQIYDKFLCTLENFLFIKNDKEKSVPTPWLYLSTQNDYAEVWHNHIRTSSFHCAYYVNVPESKGGELEYQVDEVIYSYKPKNYDLIIMPNYLNHRPKFSDSSEARISINMEMFSLHPVDEGLFNCNVKKLQEQYNV
jgi:hypothetical protein